MAFGPGALVALVASMALHATPARAEGGADRSPPPASAVPSPPIASPAPAKDIVPDDGGFSVMSYLDKHGLHDLDHESWNAYGQATYISNWKLGFYAKPGTTNAGGSNHSLGTSEEQSFSLTYTSFLGAKLWHGAEAYVVPEVIALKPLSGLTGLGGAIQNAELQKTGGKSAILYLSRAYLQQTFELGGAPVEKSSAPMQLGGTTTSRRIVVRAGDFSILDFMDKNTLAGDLRQQFMNMDFLTYAAYDFAADARGYAYGAEAELIWDDWSLRAARLTVPLHPNQEAINFRLDEYYGDQVEIEHRHQLLGQSGVVHVLGYRNREDMGRFDDAVAAFRANPGAQNATTCTGFHYDPASTNANAPDLCWARKPNVKLGIGLDIEQYLTKDIGLFFRGMYSDGQTEVYSFVSSDRSLSVGALGKGSSWKRPRDVTGLALGVSWISAAHAEYLKLGGIDGFIGDGNLNQAAESVVEAFYSVNLLRALWVTADYQHIQNPAYNADRGPVEILSGRVHAEF